MRTSPDRRSAVVRRLTQVLAGVIATGALLALAPSAAQAEVVTARAGTTGGVVGYGHQLCNPFLSSGVGRRYIELVGPLVYETPEYYQPGVITIGGDQDVYWLPYLERYVNGRWVTAWIAPQWYGEVGGFNSQLEQLQSVWVDVHSLRTGGPGHYRSGAVIWWVPNSTQPGGSLTYRLTAGNYFTDGVSGISFLGPYASATQLSTPYCHAG
jgi:hypothetical protein